MADENLNVNFDPELDAREARGDRAGTQQLQTEARGLRQHPQADGAATSWSSGSTRPKAARGDLSGALDNLDRALDAAKPRRRHRTARGGCVRHGRSVPRCVQLPQHHAHRGRAGHGVRSEPAPGGHGTAEYRIRTRSGGPGAPKRLPAPRPRCARPPLSLLLSLPLRATSKSEERNPKRKRADSALRERGLFRILNFVFRIWVSTRCRLTTTSATPAVTRSTNCNPSRSHR